MNLNVIAYSYFFADGYGRFVAYLARALQRIGVNAQPLLNGQCQAPTWLHEQWGIDWSAHAVSVLPPFYLQNTPKGSGPHWFYTMTEGSKLPDGWAKAINKSNVERVIVPCEHNADVFRRAGVEVPVSVIPAGTDPDEFPPLSYAGTYRPYKFLALGDRGARKGWVEVWQAFYKAFGTPADTPDVRLTIKVRPECNELLGLIAQASNPDPRISIWEADVLDMAEVYGSCDCFVIPSRSEGWGMPHREAAMMGLPVITQAYSGMDDGHTSKWALVVRNGKFEAIPPAFEQIAGEWMKADVPALANVMRSCYEHPETAAQFGQNAAVWLRENQTWRHTAIRLLNLIEDYH